MLELKNVSISLLKDGRSITENFSCTFARGDKAVIIGEEGNGKSTLLKFIYDKSLVEGYCDVSGEVICDGKTAYLPQMMSETLYGKTLLEYFGDTEYYLHTDVLETLSLSMDFVSSSQKIGTLSGGEKVKIQLAKILMESPDILLLDEPTNDLDIETLEWLEQFIKNTKLQVIFISHDETLIENAANMIVHMEQIIRKTKSRIGVVHCGYREYLQFRRTAFDHQAQVAEKQRSDYDKQMEKWRQIYSRVEHEQRVISRGDPAGARLLAKKMHTVLAMERRFEREKENFLDFPQEEEAIITKFNSAIKIPRGKTVLDLSIDKLCVGQRQLSQDIHLYVSGGEHIGITGKNGAGKSTLIEEIWKSLKDRRDINAAYMPQNYATVLDYEKTPIEHLSAQYTKEDLTRARTYMGSMKFTHEEMTGKIGALSGGQRAKILFLDMVLRGANVLILDEPTRNFSPLSNPVVRRALIEFGGTIISVSHDRKYLTEVCTSVYTLSDKGLEKARTL